MKGSVQRFQWEIMEQFKKFCNKNVQYAAKHIMATCNIILL